MMDLSGINQIQARIAEIEGQFSLPTQTMPGMDFAERLQQEIGKHSVSAAHKAHAVQRAEATSAAQHAAASTTANYANPELVRTIHAAAAKYAGDPEPAPAVGARRWWLRRPMRKMRRPNAIDASSRS